MSNLPKFDPEATKISKFFPECTNNFKVKTNCFADFLANIYVMISGCIYLGFYVAFNTVQVISQRVVGRAEETSTYSSSGFYTVNC